MFSLVHVIQLPLHGGGLHLDLVHGVVLPLRHDVRVDHVVPRRHVELGRVVSLALTPGEVGVGVAVIEPRWLVRPLELVVGVGETVSVRGKSQSQFVGRDRKLTNEKRALLTIERIEDRITWTAFLTLASSRSASLGGGEVKVCSVFMLTLSLTSSRSMFFLPEC